MTVGRRHRSGPSLAAIGLLACLAFAGCSAEVNVGSGSEASGEELAEEIRADYEDQTGVAMRGLTCEGADDREGETFSCSGRNARGVQLEIDGEVTDAGGSGFDYRWEVTAAVAPGVLYERALREQLEARGVALSEVRCPVEVEMEVGAELRCRATDRNGISRGVTIRLTDLDGGFDFAVDEGSEEAEAPPTGSAS